VRPVRDDLLGLVAILDLDDEGVTTLFHDPACFSMEPPVRHCLVFRRVNFYVNYVSDAVLDEQARERADASFPWWLATNRSS
jgi:hypothetical protein